MSATMQQSKPATKEEIQRSVRQWRREHNLPVVGESRKVFNKHFNSIAPKLVVKVEVRK